MTQRGRPPAHAYRGEPTSLDQLASLAGVSRGTMLRRLATMSAELAVELGPATAFGVPLQVAPARTHALGGTYLSVASLAARAGCSRSAMRARLDRGLSAEQAVAAGAAIERGYPWQGRVASAAELASLAGCSVGAMVSRLAHPGRTPEQAVAMGARGKQAHR